MGKHNDIHESRAGRSYRTLLSALTPHQTTILRTFLNDLGNDLGQALAMLWEVREGYLHIARPLSEGATRLVRDIDSLIPKLPEKKRTTH